MSRNYVQGKDYRLAGSGIAATDTSIVLTSMQLPNSNALIAMSDFGDIGFITMEPETSREENASFTGITQNLNGTATLTGVTRGLTFVSPSTTDVNLRKSHSGGSLVRVSNSVQFYENLANRYNAQSIFEVWSFTAGKNPKYLTQPTSFGDLDLIDKAFLSGAVYNYFVDTGSANTIVITPTTALTSYTAGNYFFIKVAATNTGATTINVNGLGPKALKKSVSNALIASDILAGQIILVDYDGTNFQLIGGNGGGGSGGAGIVTRSTISSFALTNGVSVFIDTEGTSGATAGNVITSDSVVSRLYLNVLNNNLNGDTIFTIYKNGVATSVTVTVPASTDGVFSDITNNFNAVGGDILSLKCDSSASGAGDMDVSFSYQIGGGGTDLSIFTANGTWTKPAGAKKVLVETWGAGGGGGSGYGEPFPFSANEDGGGGGGGAYTSKWFDAADLGATVTITVGSAGTGGAAGAGGAGDGNHGTAGGFSSFGSLLKAYGGGWGGAGRKTGGNTGWGGAGGGSASVGGNASTNPSADSDGGQPRLIIGSTQPNALGTGGGSNYGTPGCAEYGGAAGGNTGGASAGGSSLFGGSGGGGGGAAGGLTGTYTVGGGATSGAAGVNFGDGGAGGTTSVAGGAGNVAGGGGGGRGNNNSVAPTAGGNGGRGEVRVTTFL